MMWEVHIIHHFYCYNLFTPGILSFPPPNENILRLLTKNKGEDKEKSRMLNVLFRKTTEILEKGLEVPVADIRFECIKVMDKVTE